MSSVTQEVFHQFFSYMPRERKEKVLRYRNRVDQNNCVMSYMLFLYGIYQTFGIANPDIAIANRGKPYLIDYPNAHFNITHCSRGCVYAYPSTS